MNYQTNKVKYKPKSESPDVNSSILHHARNLFAEFGFDKVSTRDIADKVGIKQATLYYYFKSKQDIYKEVVLSAADFVSDRLIEALSPAVSPEEKIRNFFRTAILVFQSTTSEARLVDRELINHGEEGIFFDEETTRRPHAVLTSVIREISPKCPAEHYAYFFFSLAYGSRKQRALQLQLTTLDDLSEPEKLADALADWALHAVHASAEGVVADRHRERNDELEEENARLRSLVVDLSLQVNKLKKK